MKRTLRRSQNRNQNRREVKKLCWSEESSPSEDFSSEESGSDSGSSESWMSNEESSSSRKRTKRKRKSRSTTGKPNLSLVYSISPAVKTKVLKGKFVPLFKLLPGFDARQESAHVITEDGSVKLNVGDGSKERRLGKQILDLGQMILALLKFKDLVLKDIPKRAQDIDDYIANIVMISNKYSGVAYWFYHLYFWDKAAEMAERGEALDWSVLDAEALHAAIANNAPANCCDHCQSWYHPTGRCPFKLRSEQATQATSSRVSVFNSGQESLERERGKAYYKGKQICNRYNFGDCYDPNCKFLHMCRFCNKFDHSIGKCKDKK